MQNGYVETSAAEELPDEMLLLSLGQAREIIPAWVDDYNSERPHSSLAFATCAGARSLAPISGPRGMKGGGHVVPRLASAEWHHSLPEAAQD
jgi:putative transposase